MLGEGVRSSNWVFCCGLGGDGSTRMSSSQMTLSRVLSSTLRREIGRYALVQVGSLLGFKIMETLASLKVWGNTWSRRQALAKSDMSVGCILLVILRYL